MSELKATGILYDETQLCEQIFNIINSQEQQDHRLQVKTTAHFPYLSDYKTSKLSNTVQWKLWFLNKMESNKLIKIVKIILKNRSSVRAENKHILCKFYH